MTKRQIFVSSGTMVLAVAAVFAGRASVKFSNPSTIYVSTVGGGCKSLSIAASSVFTTGGAGVQATLRTQANITPATRRKVWGTSNCATGAVPVHFHG